VKEIFLAWVVLSIGACHIISGGDEIEVSDDEDGDSSSGSESTVTVGGGGCSLMSLEFGTSGDPDCDFCLEDLCCDALQACDSNPDCVDYYYCVDTCPDEFCTQDCYNINPAGGDAFQGIYNCGAANCFDECGGVQ
jgi:hypothetical protein